MTIFQARIEFAPLKSAPQEYDPSVGRFPSKDFAITKNFDGTTLSQYGDLKWDRTPYSARKRTCILNFKFWNNDNPTPE